MSKQKTKQSKNQPKKNLFVQITVGIVIVAFAAYFVLSNFVFTIEQNNNKGLTNAVNSPMTYTFKKEGELSFSDANGKTLSKIEIEIADDNLQRETGLMLRRNMDENKGMLFIFPTEEFQAFWMKNTIMPLDIMYVNSNKEIVKIYENAEPYSEKSLPSLKPAQFVVEVNAGYAKKYGIKEGDRIDWLKE